MSNYSKFSTGVMTLLSILFFISGAGLLSSEENDHENMRLREIAEQLMEDFQLNENIEEIAGILKEIEVKIEENENDLYALVFTAFDIVHNKYGYDKTLLVVLQELDISIPPGEVTAFKPIADEYVSALSEPCILPNAVNEGTNTKGFFSEQD